MPHGKGICKCPRHNGAAKGYPIEARHGPGICKCAKHNGDRSSAYRRDFRTLRGDGPFQCGEKSMGCGDTVMFVDCVVDHVDEDHGNNDPDNWQAMHKICHDRKSAIRRVVVNSANALTMNDHPSNNREARSERALKQHASARISQ